MLRPVLYGIGCAVMLLMLGSAPTHPASTQVLFDFEHTAALHPPDDKTQPQDRHMQAVLVKAPERAGQALHLTYRLDPQGRAEASLRLKLNGLDASAYDHLSFWVRGDAALGFAESFKIALARPEHCAPGLIQTGSEVIQGLSGRWQRFTVPLNRLNGLTDRTCLDEFILSLHPRRERVLTGGYYLDDITLIHTGQPGPHVRDPVIPARKNAWVQAMGGAEAAKPLIRARLGGWPSRIQVAKAELSTDDHAFLLRLAQDTWRGIDALTDREHGLPLDTVRLAQGSVALKDARIGDYTNITNVGLYLIAIVCAHALGFIDTPGALERLEATLATLKRLKTYQGLFYNYYDTTTLERTSNFISFVDSAWLTAGLMVARQYFPEHHTRLTRLIEQQDFRFFYDDVTQLMSHGFYVNLGDRSEYHYGLLYTEARIGSLIAIGKGDAPEEHWFRMVRTFPPDDAWQVLKPTARHLKSVRGFEFPGGYYTWEGLRYLPSWGGSLFEALMPTLVLDEAHYAPASLGLNDAIHTAVHRYHALDVLRYPVWGMSPSAMPQADNYGEYGVTFLGARGYGPGAVTPHGAALALSVMPQQAIANLKRLAALYDLYGDFGFYDAVDPLTGRVAYKYLALDQSMILIALANYLKEGVIQTCFAADPIAAKALSLLSEERFFD